MSTASSDDNDDNDDNDDIDDNDDDKDLCQPRLALTRPKTPTTTAPDDPTTKDDCSRRTYQKSTTVSNSDEVQKLF